MSRGTRGAAPRKEHLRRAARRTDRWLQAEVLEQRLALSSQSVLGATLAAIPPARPFANGLDHADPWVRTAIANITTAAPVNEFAVLDVPQSGQPGQGQGEVPGADLIESTTLLGMPAFRSDPRFIGVDGTGFSVAVLDTGIDLNHPFFGPDSDGNGIADRIVYQADFVGDSPDADDVNGHGTHVSSIIGSEDSLYGGMAPGAGIIHLRVLNDLGSGPAAAIEAALQWIVANASTYNIASVNMSLSFLDNHSSPATRPDLGLHDELAALAAQNVIVASASGNSFFSFAGAPGVGYPSADPNSLSIGAVWDSNVGGPVNWSSGAIDHTTGPDRITSFSQRHPTMTNVLAPGAAIAAAAPGGGLATLSGTSMATPHVAGIAALMQQLAVQETGQRLSLADFAELIQVTGVPVFDGDDEDDNVTNTQQLFHRVDVMAMANAIVSGGLSDLSVPGGLTASSPTIAAGGITRLDFMVANQGPTGAGSVSSGVYLSADSTIDSSDVLLASFVDELGAGQSVARTKHALQIPADITAGSYFLGILIDQQGVVNESNEGNNVAAIPVIVAANVAEIWMTEVAGGTAVIDGVTSVGFGEVNHGQTNAVRTFRVFNDGTVDLLLGQAVMPAGFAVAGLPASVAPLTSVDFTMALVASSPDGSYSGDASFTTNDTDEDPFSIRLAGTVDHGDFAAQATGVAAGSSVDGVISPSGEADWFRFDALRNVHYRFETTLGTLSDSVLRLIGVNGATQLALNDNGPSGLGSVIEWTAPADGAYYLEARGQGLNTGSYQLSLAAGDDHGNDHAAATPTSDPSVNHGILADPGDVDWFAFHALAGIQYQFATTLFSLAGAELHVVGVDGATELASLGQAGGGAPLEWTAPEDGMYFVTIEAASPAMIGSYDLSIVGDDDHGDSAADATAMAIPATASGEIEVSNDADWFVIVAVAGARYQFATTLGSLLDSKLRVIDADGATELAISDNHGGGLASVIEWTAPASGVFYMEVTGGNGQVGTFDLAATVLDDHGNDAASATPATDPSSAPGVIEATGDVDWFSFQAFAGVAYRVETTPGALPATTVRLVGSDGVSQLAASAGQPGQPAIIDWTAPADGRYYIEVAASTAGDRGGYLLSIIGDDDYGDNLQNAAAIFAPFDGVIERAGDADWFSISTLAGLEYRIEIALGTLQAAAVRVLEADGVTEVASSIGADGDSATVQWTAATSGVYYVEVTEYVPEAASSLSAAAAALAAEEPAPVATVSVAAGGSYTITPTLQSVLPGNYDHDLDVDGNDFLLWQRSLGSTSIVRPLDSRGFERYEEIALDGQNKWQQLGPPTGKAVVQSDIVKSGSQAVRVDRAAGADNRWGVPLGVGFPSGDFILVTWDMRVSATGAEDGALGPFLGMEAYDDKGVFGLLGSLGVDATTLDVLYQRQDSGVLMETGQKVLSNAWYNYAALFDFTANQYTVYLEGQTLATTGFVDRGPGPSHDDLDQFTDADISALAAQANSKSQLITGTAYFDNFRIIDGPAAETLAADGNEDGVVDGIDLQTWNSHFGLTIASGLASSAGSSPPLVSHLQQEIVDGGAQTIGSDSYSAAAPVDTAPISRSPLALAVVEADPPTLIRRDRYRPPAYDGDLALPAATNHDRALRELTSDSYAPGEYSEETSSAALGFEPADLNTEDAARIFEEFDDALTDLFG